MATWNTGSRNGLWKGGRSLASSGYILVRVGKEHHLSDVRGYAYEHRLVAEQKIGQPLLKGEQVHHLNGDKTDNRPENLEVCSSQREHRFKHRRKTFDRRRPGEPNEVIQCACGCGRTFKLYDKNGRPRRFVTGHNSAPQ